MLAKRLIVTEELEEDYPAIEHREEQDVILQTVAESGSRFTRRGLLKLGAAAAGTSLGVALLVPLASMGPILDMMPFYTTPWRRGRRLVDQNGRPYRASDIQEEALLHRVPEGRRPREHRLVP